MTLLDRCNALGVFLVLLSLSGGVQAASVRYSYAGPQLNSILTVEYPLVCPSVPYPGCPISRIAVDLVMPELAPNQPLQLVQPASWSVSDGLINITNQTAGYGAVFQLGTDGAGAVTSWNIAVTRSDANLAPGDFSELATYYPGLHGFHGKDLSTYYCAYPDYDGEIGVCLDLYTSTDLNPSDPEVAPHLNWQMTVVPVPSALLLFGSALLALGRLRRPASAA